MGWDISLHINRLVLASHMQHLSPHQCYHECVACQASHPVVVGQNDFHLSAVFGGHYVEKAVPYLGVCLGITLYHILVPQHFGGQYLQHFGRAQSPYHHRHRNGVGTAHMHGPVLWPVPRLARRWHSGEEAVVVCYIVAR